MKTLWLVIAFLLASASARADIAIANSTIVDSGGAYTAAAGSDRLLVWPFGAMKSTETAPVISTVTHGAATLTQAGSSAVSATQSYAFADEWYLKEANIIAGSQTMTATFSVVPNDTTYQGNAYTLTGVDQTTPLVDSDIAVGTAVTGLTSPSVDVEAGGVAIFIVVKDSDSDTFNTPSGYTKVSLGNFGFSGAAAAYSKLITSAGTEAPAITWTGAGNGALKIASFRRVGSTSGLLLRRRRS